MSGLYLTLTIIGFFILLILNIFYLYIPLAEIDNSLNDIEAKIVFLQNRLEPILLKVEPLVESIVDPLL